MTPVSRPCLCPSWIGRIENPYKLVNLWDMQKFPAVVLLTDLMWLQNGITTAQYDEEHFRDELAHILDGIKQTSGWIGFHNLVAQAERLKRSIAAGANLPTLITLSGELIASIQQEYMHRLFLFVPNNEKPYFESNQFSEQAADKFGSAVFDMIEAGKCFALDRHTACVFHLMRVLEVCLEAFCKTLGFVPKNENWHEILKHLPAEIQKQCNPHCGNPNWKDDEHFYSELIVEFRHFKNAWRNYVMHAHEKYVKSEAENIFSHVKSFADHAASRLSDV